MVLEQEPRGLSSPSSPGVTLQRALGTAGAAWVDSARSPCPGAQPFISTSSLKGKILAGMLGEAQVQSHGISERAPQNSHSVPLLAQKRTKKFT